MAERFFSGFEFRKFEPPKPPEAYIYRYKPTDALSTPVEKEIVRLNDLIRGSPDIIDIVESEPEVWTFNQLQQDFARQLSEIDRQTITPRLTMHNRTFKFVTRDEMRPKSDAERKRLVERYGDYIVDGRIGDCKRNADGTFELRIGFAGQENSASKESVLEMKAHEYGHSLGQHLEDTTLEELKAYTFENLFMRYYCNANEYRVSRMDALTIHDTASFWLEQLLDAGIKEEAILAHLTGERFGKYYPDGSMFTSDVISY